MLPPTGRVPREGRPGAVRARPFSRPALRPATCHSRRRCAMSLPLSFSGTSYSTIARAIAVCSSGALSMMPTNFAGMPLMGGLGVAKCCSTTTLAGIFMFGVEADGLRQIFD